MDNANIAKELGQAQCLLIKMQLDVLTPEERKQRLQKYWNMLQAIMDVLLEHAEVMYSKYAVSVFAYQELFNIKGGDGLKIDGLNLKEDCSKEKQEVLDYLTEMHKKGRKKK